MQERLRTLSLALRTLVMAGIITKHGDATPATYSLSAAVQV
jgi:hypothetical protein